MTSTPRSLAATLTTFAALGALAACGGKARPPATTPEAPARAAEKAPVPGDSYGGEGYGGEGYGDAEQGVWGDDPCGSGGPLIAESPPVPADPPELAAYLPTLPAAAGSPDPAMVYAVPLHDSPSVGLAGAPVTVVTTYEFADPYSDRLRPTFVALRERYGKDLRLVWKHFIVHRQVQVAALGACAAARQGKFEPFMNELYDRVFADGQRRWDLGAVSAVAAGVGLDAQRFDTDLRSQGCKDEVIRDQSLFAGLGQAAVPVTWINGRPLMGAQPIESFVQVIDEELAKAKAALARKGAKAADYYPNLVKTGRTSP